MNNTNIKIALRRMIKEKTISIVTLVGLSLGIACAIILTSWVLYEISYEKHIPDSDKIYRITLEGIINNEFIQSSQALAGIAPEAKKDFPEVDAYARIVNNYKDCIIKTEDKESFRESGYAADSTFFNIFPYKAIHGNLNTALALRDQIVIDQYLSDICFGDKNPIGEFITVNDHQYKVAAVMENIPAHTHLRFHFLIPLLNVDYVVNNPWGGDNCITFLKLNRTDNNKTIESKITDLVYSREKLWENLNIKFRLQALPDIYLSNYKFDYAEETGSKRNIVIFSIAAFLILLIACINFTNLFIASSLKRKRAVGIKLTNGASKIHILKESFFEVLLFLTLSFLIAVVLVKVIQPLFSTLAGKEIMINIFSWQFLSISIPIILVSLILTSVFPWLHLKRLNPARILKEKNPSGRKNFSIQKVLVTTQFVIAIVLIFSVIAVSKQLSFIQNKELGFNKENIIYVYTTEKLQEKVVQDRMKNELLGIPNIQGLAFRSSLPTIWNNGNPLSKNPDFKEIMATEEIFVDKDYFDLMQIHFVEGENIYKKDNPGKNFCIVNQMAAKNLGLEEPYLDKVIYEGANKPLVIKGVIENINIKSLAQGIDPCIYRGTEKKSNNAVMLIKISNNYNEAISAVRSFCTENNSDVPFEYHFLDEVYDNLYQSETTVRSIMLLFALIAITIISLGLLAMILFITESRIKEIGVRKVNGAKISEVMVMLNRDFVKWVIIAFVIATPIAYYTMNKWLENFAYKTTLSWWIFALAGLLALGIALLTVSFQSWRAATKNPVESLRYE